MSRFFSKSFYTMSLRKDFFINQKGVTLIAAIFFLVIVALFGILAIRLVSIDTISSAEGYRYIQSGFAAISGRELKFLYIDRNGTLGWDGCSTLYFENCAVEQVGGDVNASGDNETVLFRLKGSCGSEGEAVSRVWEAVFQKP